MNSPQHEAVNKKASSIKTRPFGNLPLTVAEIGFGTSQLANTDHKFKGVKYVAPRQARGILDAAIENGINLFDTSPNYGNAESLLGEAKKQYEQNIYVATKAGLRPDGIRDFSPSFLEAQVDKSLKALNVDYLDIFQLNKPTLEILYDGQLFSFLDTLKKKGKIRYSGVIIGDVKTGRPCIDSGKVDCLQILYNLLYQETEDLIREASQGGLGIIIRSPLNSGVLCGAYTVMQTFDPNDERSNFFSGPAFTRRLDVLHNIQKDLNIPDSQLLEYSLRFILSNPNVSLIIPAASRLNQLERIKKCGENYSPFTQAEFQKIRETVADHMKELSLEFQNY